MGGREEHMFMYIPTCTCTSCLCVYEVSERGREREERWRGTAREWNRCICTCCTYYVTGFKKTLCMGFFLKIEFDV